jgi:hypothetical protein
MEIEMTGFRAVKLPVLQHSWKMEPMIPCLLSLVQILIEISIDKHFFGQIVLRPSRAMCFLGCDKLSNLTDKLKFK